MSQISCCVKKVLFFLRHRYRCVRAIQGFFNKPLKKIQHIFRNHMKYLLLRYIHVKIQSKKRGFERMINGFWDFAEYHWFYFLTDHYFFRPVRSFFQTIVLTTFFQMDVPRGCSIKFRIGQKSHY